MKKSRGSVIFEEVKICLENKQLNLPFLRVCTDGAPSMIGRTAGTLALPERFLVSPLLKYHCICVEMFVLAAFYDVIDKH